MVDLLGLRGVFFFFVFGLGGGLRSFGRSLVLSDAAKCTEDQGACRYEYRGAASLGGS
jgi:hypothetical protein